MQVAQAPDFARLGRELYQNFEKAGSLLLEAIAAHLGLDKDYFNRQIRHGNSILRSIFYPPITHEPASAIRAEQHEDINLITLLVGASAGGLELLNSENQWVPIMPEADEIVINVGDMLQRLTNNYLKKNYDDIGTVLAKTITRIDELRNKQEDISGVPSGFPSLDRVTYGWQPTDLIILAARPSVGKTAFALNLARNAALNPIKPTAVGFFSLEMSSSQLVQRILSAESDIHLEKISRGKLEDYEMQQLYSKGVNRLSQANIFIDDTAALNIFEFRAKARRLVNKHNVGIIIIDYLQLMSGSGDRNTNREQEISTISRSLKALAKELQIPIIALSQLSRAVESRKESKVPQLSDLRESGAIEQDADMVMFIYRPEYYELNTNEMGESNKGETNIRIAKHRNGSLENIKLRALLHVQRFEEWEEDGGPGIGGNFKPISTLPTSGGSTSGGDAKLYIQKGSRMNNGEFDEGFDEPTSPF